MSLPAVGDRAPEVALPDETGTFYRLSDQHDRWTLIYFYPEDDTPGCTTEACQFRDLDEDIRAEGAQVWGISPDGAASHRRFRDKFSLPFPLLSDEDHAVAEAYGAWALKKNYGREYLGIVRSSFLVGPDGRIAQVWPRVKADGHAAEVLAAIAAAKAGTAG
jgi:peroxiredoxin Q/BCP